MGLFQSDEDKAKKAKETEDRLRKNIDDAEKNKEIPHFDDVINSLAFFRSNQLKRGTGYAITGMNLMGLGFNAAASAKARELSLSLANNELLGVLVRQNNEIIKLLKKK